MGYINADQTANLGRYNQTKQLLSVSSEFYVQINVSCLNSGAPAYPSSGANGFPLIAIGSEPMKPTQVSRVVRDIVIPVSSGITNPPVYYYYGTMTVTMWTNKSTI